MLKTQQGQQLFQRISFVLERAQNFGQTGRLKGLSERLVAHRRTQLEANGLEEPVLHSLNEVCQAAFDAAE